MEQTQGPTADALIEQATRLRKAGRLDEALAAYRAAAAAAPDSPKALQHLGAFVGQLGRLDEAEALLRETLRLAPGDAATRYSLAGLLMAGGRYAEGWALYDARFELPELRNRPPDLPFPRWRSWHPRGRRILVFPEQGLGDQIQFARFVPQLAEWGAEVTLLAPPPLFRLFRDSFPMATVRAAEGEVQFADPDFWVMSSDLPGLCGATPDALPSAPYLTAGAPSHPRDGFSVGIMTRGNPALTQDAYRSLPPDVAGALRAALPGRVVELDPASSGASDFADTAALVAGLDLVVSVDTAVAHLAGALGKTCFTLVRSFASDWRWTRGEDRTPWYPAMRLYWSALPNDWTAAVDRLARDARALAAAR